MSPDQLSHEDLMELHQRFYETRAATDRARLIERYRPLACRLAAHSTKRLEDREDMLQVALIGLLTALEHFDPQRGTSFTTFAWATVGGHLKRHHRDWDWGLRVPRSLQARYLHTAGAAEALGQEYGRRPTVAEIAARTGDVERDAREAVDVQGAYRLTSLDATAEAGLCTARQLRIQDHGFTEVDDRILLDALLARLPAEERKVVVLRFVDELTQAQIAARVGFSQVGVSRLLAKSLAKLRRWAEADYR